MIDVKQILETARLPVKRGWFIKPPKFPYITYTESIDCNGTDDFSKRIISREIEVNLYNDKTDSILIERIRTIILKFGVEFSENTVFQAETSLTYYNFKLIDKEN